MSNSSTFAARTAQIKGHRLAETSKDIDAVLSGKGQFAFTEAINNAIDSMGIDTSAVFAKDRNPKAIKRFIQFMNAVHHKEYKSIDRTSAIVILSLHQAGDFDLHTDALRYLAAGSKGETDANTRGVSRRTLQRLIGAVGVNTIQTQLSRSVGRNGFLQLIGATMGEPGKVNQKVSLNREHALVKTFINMIEKASAGQIDEMVKDI